MSGYFTPDEVADSRGLDRKTVYRAIHTGRLRAENWGSSRRPRFLIPEDALEALLYRPGSTDCAAPGMARPARDGGEFTRLARDGVPSRGYEPGQRRARPARPPHPREESGSRADEEDRT